MHTRVGIIADCNAIRNLMRKKKTISQITRWTNRKVAWEEMRKPDFVEHGLFFSIIDENPSEEC